MNIAVIPARGGSKRIPNKNIKPFAGMPIIAYSIEAASQTGLFDRVIVSTDDKEIAAVAKECGADVPFMRPSTLADDHTGTNAVAKQAISWLNEHVAPVEYACCIYATAPFVQVKILQDSYKRLLQSAKSFAFSVTSYSFPIQRSIKITDQDGIEPFFPESMKARSQDLEEAFHDAGQFYWGRANAFLDDEELFSSNSIPVILPRYLVQDIDTCEDWQRAELMFQAWQKQVATD
jgi:pseudaminic acid cytidylyltransferase